jgi:autotransporter-associated beta strand protein
MILTNSSAAKVGATVVNSIASVASSLYNFHVFEATTISRVISGALGVVKTGIGTLIFSNINSYSGATTINAGTLRLQAGATNFYNTSNRTYNINNGSRLVFAAGAATNPTLHGTIINIDSNGGATITLDSINGLIQSITGVIINSNGGLQNRLVSINGFFNDQGGINRPVVFNIASGSDATADFWADCDVIGRCELTKNGSGKLLFTRGLVGWGVVGMFGEGVTNIRINSGTMEVGGGASAAYLNQKSGSLFLNNGTFIWSSTAANQSIINAITGAGNIIKRNSGTLIFSANNSYSGATSIEAGTLRVTTLISGTSGKFSQANFTNTTLTVTFSVAPLAGETYQLFPGATTQGYPAVSLVGATGRTATYNSLNSTLTIA